MRSDVAKVTSCCKNRVVDSDWSPAPYVAMNRDERRSVVARVFKQLSEERAQCSACITGKRPYCKEPHAKPCKTIAWALDQREYTIVRDIEAMRAEYREEQKVYINAHEEMVLRNLEWVQAQAMAAWECSKLPYTQTLTASQQEATGARRSRAQKTLRERTGDPRYLQTILAVQQQRRDIWGLDSPKRQVLMTPGGSDTFGDVMKSVARIALQNVLDIDMPPISIELPAHTGNGNGAGSSADSA